MTNYKNIPALRFKEFEGEWKKTTINKVLSIGSGKDYKHLEIGDIPVYGSGGYMLSVNKYLYEGESVCIGRKGTIDKPIFLNEKFWTVDTLFYTHSFVDSIPYFVYLLFNRINWYKYNEASGVPSLSKKTILKIKINLPTKPEQQKIANFLTAIDTKIQQLRQKQELLETYKKGVMQQIFKQEIRFKKDDGGDFEDWEVKRLGEVANITTGNSNREDSGLTGKYAFFDRSKDIRTSEIYLFDGEAIIVAGEGQEFIPKYFIGKFDLHQRTYAIMNFKESNSKFLFYLIHYNRNYFFRQAVGSTVKSLRLPMFKKMPLLLPSLPEQQKIATFLSSIDKRIASVKAEIEAMEKYKQGLLQQLFV